MQYFYLATEQAGTYLKISVLKHHLTCIYPSSVGCEENAFMIIFMSFKLQINVFSQFPTPPFQLPRVIEGGVEVNDSREFDLHSGWHWQLGGGGLHSGSGGVQPTPP